MLCALLHGRNTSEQDQLPAGAFNCDGAPSNVGLRFRILDHLKDEAPKEGEASTGDKGPGFKGVGPNASLWDLGRVT